MSIKIENVDVYGFEASIRGMRSPMNSWDKSDSHFGRKNTDTYVEIGGKKYYALSENIYGIGENDLKLMKNLSKAGTDHSKFLRMINVTVDITAPRFWWTEFDTYRVGVEKNSCSTMHTIHKKPFERDDFSIEYICKVPQNRVPNVETRDTLDLIIDNLNTLRELYLETNDKEYWRQIIELLPQSYNQKRTVQLNYQVLKSMYFARKNHKLDEWVDFCKWCETLPYFSEICINN